MKFKKHPLHQNDADVVILLVDFDVLAVDDVESNYDDDKVCIKLLYAAEDKLRIFLYNFCFLLYIIDSESIFIVFFSVLMKCIHFHVQKVFF